MDGALGSLYEDWRKRLIHMRAMIEADFDFADEEDIPGSVADQVWGEAFSLHGEIADHLRKSESGERLRSGLQVVLMGAPNAGKSSLLNAIAGRDVAIVTEEAGTTRDVIEVHLDLGGYPVTLVDTAGLRETNGLVEREGIRRAEAKGRGADLILWAEEPDGVEIDDAKSGLPADLQENRPVWIVRTKSDFETHPKTRTLPETIKEITASTKKPDGITALIDCADVFCRRNDFDRGSPFGNQGAASALLERMPVGPPSGRGSGPIAVRIES